MDLKVEQNKKYKTLKKAIVKSGVLALIAYPALIVVLSMVNLFQNKSFSFAGYELVVTLTENTARATLTVHPFFLGSVLLLFIVAFFVIWFAERVLTSRKSRAV